MSTFQSMPRLHSEMITKWTSPDFTIGILTGGPGCGKTSLIKHLFLIEPEKTCLLASTGNAVDRLVHVIDADTGLSAQICTLARATSSPNLIEQFKNWSFIVDESSMVSIEDAFNVLQVLLPKKLLFVGDINQLPCVNAVSILTTLCQIEKIPRVHLTENLRQLHVHKALCKNLAMMGTMNFIPIADEDSFILHEDTNPVKCALDIYSSLGGNAQMIAFTKAECQRLIDATVDTSAPKLSAPFRQFRIGDRVQCTRNHYQKKTGKLQVANGTMGIITKRGVEYDNGFQCKYGETYFTCSRCINVHQSQGNEFDVPGIIILSPWRAEEQLKIVYTAISRFKERVHIIYKNKRELANIFKGPFQHRVDHKIIDFFKT